MTLTSSQVADTQVNRFPCSPAPVSRVWLLWPQVVVESRFRHYENTRVGDVGENCCLGIRESRVCCKSLPTNTPNPGNTPLSAFLSCPVSSAPSTDTASALAGKGKLTFKGPDAFSQHSQKRVNLEWKAINNWPRRHFSGSPHRFCGQRSTPGWSVLWQAAFPQVSPGSHQQQREKR